MTPSPAFAANRGRMEHLLRQVDEFATELYNSIGGLNTAQDGEEQYRQTVASGRLEQAADELREATYVMDNATPPVQTTLDGKATARGYSPHDAGACRCGCYPCALARNHGRLPE